MKTNTILKIILPVFGFAALSLLAIDGYKDTPIVPGTQWHEHDPDRPQPKVITPGKTFSEMAPPPSDATVLFDGKDLSKFTQGGAEPRWTVTNGFFETGTGGRGGIRSKEKFADFQMHLEFSAPIPAKGSGQGRGNSGVLIGGMYEVQVLDCYTNQTYPDGQTGALYGQTPPLVNVCRPPGEWQTYEILFESPRWDAEGKLVKKANVTVIQNGVVLHNKREYLGPTDGIGNVPHRTLGVYKQHPPEIPIEIQDHNNPVRFRNIWIRSIGEYDKL